MANITQIRDLLDYVRQWLADPATLAWSMELPVLRVPCCLFQELKVTLPGTAFTCIDQVLCKSSPHPLVSPSFLELVVGLLPWQHHGTPHLTILAIPASLLPNSPPLPALHTGGPHPPPSCPHIPPGHQMTGDTRQGPGSPVDKSVFHLDPANHEGP